MNNALPVSQLVISATIPANHSRYVADIDRKSFANNIDLSINSVTVKIDTTALYNITATNTFVARKEGGKTTTVTIHAGYYNKDSLKTAMQNYVNFTDDGYAYPIGDAYDVDMSGASDLQRILGWNRIQEYGVRGYRPVDISNGLNCVKLYSNIVKQMIPNHTTTLCDCFIFSAMGLQNITSLSHLNIPVRDVVELDNIQFDLRNRYDEPISIACDVYVTMRLSVNLKV